MTALKHICVALFVLFLGTAALAQRSELARIDTLVRSIDKNVKKKAAMPMVFADIADETASNAKWQAFASEAALEKHREKSETYTIAYAWKKDRKLAAANFTLFSPSGDWTKYVYSYYRPDGSLAKAEVDYRTFYGDIILEQDLYFNAAGRQLKKRERFLDLHTRKPKKITSGMRETTRSMARETGYFKSATQLPFSELVK